MNTHTKASLSLLLSLLLLLLSCTPTQVVSNLQMVVDAAEIAIPILGSAAGMSSQAQAQIIGYLQQVNVAAGEAAVVLESSDSVQVKSAKIVALFAGVAHFNLPPGVPSTVAAVIQAVASAVANFLANFSTATFSAGMERTTERPVKVKITSADRAKLEGIRLKAMHNLADKRLTK